MNIEIFETKKELGVAAANKGAELIDEAIKRNGKANIVLATGTSQFETLEELVKKELDWTKVTCFHLDEYIGIPMTHSASFGKYLKERFVDKTNIGEFNFINGETNPKEECKRLNARIDKVSIDVTFAGIGENGHLAFNDPPANFDTNEPYIIVELDEACKRQQMGEGWFKSLTEVPKGAITMSIKQILKSKNIICSIPDKRKDIAVKNTIENKITPNIPASILRTHTSTWLYLDKEAALLL
ncbi:glucosamine-6-phosphate deaminase [Flagellimonas olearia]|uniref:Glucosamine-6-phosphate deaminase n=1 Tax=Flagellimonas olearia TaxID=552546 RepID=A0A6I1E372_9FLAO|nr:glucosamine-6-phosphate deaminase [Allomuricauda olearia]KAB7530391.1 glucosamine-6-phosphate deaminase [Allomuricauda olearia]